MEELWSLDNNMDQFAFKRLDDGTWMLQASQQGEYGVPTVFPDRKQLKDLHDAIEMELYPERFKKKTLEELRNTIWDHKPTRCPVCNEPLKPKTIREDAEYCPNHHGQIMMGQFGEQVLYRWHMFPSSLHKTPID